MIRRNVEQRLKLAAMETPQGGTAGLRTVLFMALFSFSTLSNAATFHWDGRTFIPLGLQARSETVLRMPEAIESWWPEEATLNANTIDERTLSFSPKSANVEQRVFLRGESGKLYLAKASTRLKYTPLIQVIDVSVKGPAEGPPEITPDYLMLKLMRNERPAGFAAAKSTRRLLESGEYRIDALEVWASPRATGILATLTRASAPGTTVEVHPAEIELYIPDLGTLRWIGADKWALDDAVPATRAYLVFMKE